MRFLIGLILVAFPALAVAFETEVFTHNWNGGKHRVILDIPKSESSLPAVIYVHGAIVEHGYLEAARKGYDISGFVRALSQAGFASIAPLRTTSSEEDAVMSIKAALDFLSQHPRVDDKRISLLGFSKGARHVQDFLRSQVKEEHLSSVVLMSPAVSEVNLSKFMGPAFVSAGLEDPEGIRKAVERLCQQQLPAVECRLYPGDHQWFWQVRPEYWNDVIQFLTKKHASHNQMKN
jgi:dienelactone hydrolase